MVFNTVVRWLLSRIYSRRNAKRKKLLIPKCTISEFAVSVKTTRILSQTL